MLESFIPLALASGTDVFVRLMLALGCGTLLGFERQWFHKNAGLKTTTLVALGSAVFGMLSLGPWPGGGSATQMAVGIITGVGFLGGGVIFHVRQSSIQGINSAATIWMTAALGLAAGVGAGALALVGVCIAFIMQFTHRQMAHTVDFLRTRGAPRELRLEVSLTTAAQATHEEHLAKLVEDYRKSAGARVVELEYQRTEGQTTFIWVLENVSPLTELRHALLDKLEGEPAIKTVRYNTAWTQS
jgi:putative Mg2+ transporter-C (MgtC) family protein